ncbi:lipoate-protein ligase LplJ [Gossypium australe]|uniref:Lipoate-protein ligase LplJ n=1 Tax=Gossypium australe TaxID=47621 RepID=A0A5B6UNF3_9ROSI|nr:lipoate-protein ligase LplJ [Gossypium australe]
MEDLTKTTYSNDELISEEDDIWTLIERRIIPSNPPTGQLNANKESLVTTASWPSSRRCTCSRPPLPFHAPAPARRCLARRPSFRQFPTCHHILPITAAACCTDSCSLPTLLQEKRKPNLEFRF